MGHHGPVVRRLIPLALALGLATGCAARSAPVAVAQSGVTLARLIGQMQEATITLHRAEVLSTHDALRVQERLLVINQHLERVVPMLRTIEARQGGDLETAFLLLKRISAELGEVLGWVPLGELSAALIDAIRAAQQVVTTTLMELERVREGGR